MKRIFCLLALFSILSNTCGCGSKTINSLKNYLNLDVVKFNAVIDDVNVDYTNSFYWWRIEATITKVIAQPKKGKLKKGDKVRIFIHSLVGEFPSVAVESSDLNEIKARLTNKVFLFKTNKSKNKIFLGLISTPKLIDK